MTGFLHENEFSRKSFVKGGGALIVGLSLAGTAGKARTREAEADDECAAALQECLARKLALVQKAGHHLPPFAITAAACLIADRIRG